MSDLNGHSLGARVVLVVAALGLAGCSTVSDAWDSTTEAIGGLFGGEDDGEPAPADAATDTASESQPSGGLVTGTVPGAGGGSGAFRSGSGAPDLASVPSQAPTPPSSAEDRRRATEGLLADRERAKYTDQVGRREPVTVRPLNAASAEAAPATPPVPAAARAEPVTRVADVPAAAPAEPVSPRTTDLAERLGAAPPPPPPPASGAAAPPAPVAAVAATAQAPAVQALVPQYVPPPADYGAETLVIDSSGVQGGGWEGSGRQLASVSPRAAFDPGNASVSSQIGTISFGPGSAALNAAARAVLADAARLRADVDGAIRVVARGEQAQARAAAVTRELRRLGVPAARLYEGAADGWGDDTEIYLDY